MARQAINIGSTANDGTGDPLRTAFNKINDNFVEVYGALNPSTSNLKLVGDSLTSENTKGTITIDPAGTGTIELASSANITGSLTVTGLVDAVSLNVDTLTTSSNQNLTIAPGGTGQIILDGIAVSDNTISSADSNANLELKASGTGGVIVAQSSGKLGFYGVTPVAQASAIAFDPLSNDGSTVDDLRQIINSILVSLRNVGIIAS